MYLSHRVFRINVSYWHQPLGTKKKNVKALFSCKTWAFLKPLKYTCVYIYFWGRRESSYTSKVKSRIVGSPYSSPVAPSFSVRQTNVLVPPYPSRNRSYVYRQLYVYVCVEIKPLPPYFIQMVAYLAQGVAQWWTWYLAFFEALGSTHSKPQKINKKKIAYHKYYFAPCLS